MDRFCVLIVDDEDRIINFLKIKLKTAGYKVLIARDGVSALEQAQTQGPDLIVLDILMPVMDGFETLKQLRTFSMLPVIVLSAKGSDLDRIKGLGLGADDYLAKPFNPDELVARIEAIRRRFNSSELLQIPEPFSIPGLKIDFEKHLVTVRSQEIYLTRIEWLLLSELAHNAGRLMLYGDLLTRVWGPEYRDDVQILRTWISRLRYKIEESPNKPKIILTVPKTGYIIDKPEP
jgi:two-component system KDP operon response regulator KdpE